MGSPGFSWLDLRALLIWSPATSAYARANLGEEISAWADVQVQLLATVVDLLAGANWQRAGKKGGSKPKPLKRPGGEVKVGGSTLMELDELDKFLGWSPRQ